MNSSIRVGYDIDAPPYIFSCAHDDYITTPYTAECPFPGLTVEIVASILRILKRPVISINGSIETDASDTIDVVGVILPLEEFKIEKLDTTIPILYDYISVITTDRPKTDGNDLLAFMNPFTSVVWIGVLLVVLMQKIFSRLVTKVEHSQNGTKIRSSASRATLLPVALCMVVLTGLYKSGLLTNLILRKKTYMVEDLNDLANLPPDVEFRGYVNLWVHKMLVDNL